MSTDNVVVDKMPTVWMKPLLTMIEANGTFQYRALSGSTTTTDFLKKANYGEMQLL